MSGIPRSYSILATMLVLAERALITCQLIGLNTAMLAIAYTVAAMLFFSNAKTRFLLRLLC